jgi:predicted aldo/keto reductase-like oxidoreductase
MFENYSQSVRNYSKLIDQKKDAAQCAECGECEKKCPQHIDVIKELKVAHEAMIGWMNPR